MPKYKKIPVSWCFAKAETFWSHVDNSSSPNGCWNWIGAKNHDGYGMFGPAFKAHRVAWVLATGNDPGNIDVLHTCDNRKCIRFQHLYLGTQKENSRDRQHRGHTVIPHPAGENNPLAKFTQEQIKTIRKEYEGSWGMISKLAKKYNVSTCAMRNIIRNISYKEIA